MMHRTIVPLLLAAVVLAGCSKPRQVVVLDGWMAQDLAKKTCTAAAQWMKDNKSLVARRGCANVPGCPILSRQTSSCTAGGDGGYHAFEQSLAARFAAEEGCANVALVTLKTSKDKVDADADARWQLMIDYSPGASQQRWNLAGPSSSYRQSAGTAADIARGVCQLVNS